MTRQPHVILFAGAGASAALDPETYPTTAAFFEKLPKPIREDQLFLITESHLKDTIPPPAALDIEQILGRLAQFHDSLSPIIDDERHALAKMMKLNEIRVLLPNSTVNWEHLELEAGKLQRRATALTDKIHEEIYNLYGTPPADEQLDRTWFPLLRRLAKQGTSTDIFTTNYDLVLEVTADRLKPDVVIANGRTIAGASTILDTSLWGPIENENRSSAKAEIRVTKLHGSLDWHRDGKTIRWGNPSFMGDHARHVILYPAFKGKPEHELFRTFHDYFRKTLTRVTHAVFIGFAFRDEYLNDLLTQHFPDDATALIVNPDSHLATPLPKTRVKRITEGFGMAAVDKIIAALE